MFSHTPLPSLVARGAKVLVAASLFALSLSIVPGGAFLKLKDGRVLQGIDVRLEGDLYYLRMEGQGEIPIPRQLVEEVGLANEPEPPGPPPGEPEVRPPSGLVPAEAQVLAGVPVAPPRTADQLAVFGEPAKFQEDIVRSNLHPTYWAPDPDGNNFNPSTWAKAPTDPNWHPTSAFDESKDVLADSRSSWQPSITNPNWQPTDGFAKR